MNTPNPDLDALRRLLESSQADAPAAPSPASPAARSHAAARHMAAALAGGLPAAGSHAPAQAQMAAAAAAELRGDDVDLLFPELGAHLDLCDACALEYADLLEFLLEMDAAAQGSAQAPAPSAAALQAILDSATERAAAEAGGEPPLAGLLRRWLEGATRAYLEARKQSSLGLSAVVDELVAAFLAPSKTEPMRVRFEATALPALGMGSADETTLAVLVYAMAAAGVRAEIGQGGAAWALPLDDETRARLEQLVERHADDAARRLKIAPRERDRLVAAALHRVQEDPSAFASLVLAP